MSPSPSALLRRATVYYHTDKFQMAAEDLRVVLKEEPHNSAATVGHIPLCMQVPHRPAGGKLSSRKCVFVSETFD